MAQITFGLSSSHGPLLSTPPDQWTLRVQADRENNKLAFRGKTYGFDELVQLRFSENLNEQTKLAIRTDRHAACQKAIKQLAQALKQAAPDVLLLIGNDQREIFTESLTPAFSILHGESFKNIALNEKQLLELKPGLAIAHWANVPKKTVTYPCVPELGRHLIESLTKENFDITAMKMLPEGPQGRRGIPHAYGFIYSRIMNDITIPAVPIVLNTFYPPNQPTVKRCFEFGEAIRRSIESWDQDVSVGVISSGGLSHFVIDETFDKEVLSALQSKQKERIISIPSHFFRSGTSETKKK